MKILPCLFSALTVAAASLVVCSSGFADTPQTANLTIENHQRLVTVKDDGGKWLFAQVISTSNVKVSQVLVGKDLSRISLQDGTGKTLWSKAVNYSIRDGSPHGEWSDKFVGTLIQASKSLGWKASDTDPTLDVKQLDSVVGSEDQLVKIRISTSKHSIEITPIKNGFAAKTDEGKTLVVLQPPAVPAAPVVAQVSTP